MQHGSGHTAGDTGHDCLVLHRDLQRLVCARNGCKKALAQADVRLARRCNPVPDPMESARSCIAYEKANLESVIAARNAAESEVRCAVWGGLALPPLPPLF
jgi:hypothetical protein